MHSKPYWGAVRKDHRPARYFYDANGELIFTYGSSAATIIEDLRQPVFGVLEVTPTLDGLAGAAAPAK